MSRRYNTGYCINGTGYHVNRVNGTEGALSRAPESRSRARDYVSKEGLEREKVHLNSKWKHLQC